MVTFVGPLSSHTKPMCSHSILVARILTLRTKQLICKTFSTLYWGIGLMFQLIVTKIVAPFMSHLRQGLYRRTKGQFILHTKQMSYTVSSQRMIRNVLNFYEPFAWISEFAFTLQLVLRLHHIIHEMMQVPTFIHISHRACIFLNIFHVFKNVQHHVTGCNAELITGFS